MEDRKKTIDMYVLRLDNSRIFWISLMLFFIVVLCFFMGFFLGRKLDSNINNNMPEHSTFFKSTSQTITSTNDNFEFYHVLSKEKLSKEDIIHSIPKEKRVSSKPVKKAQIVVEHKFPKAKSKTMSSKKKIKKTSLKKQKKSYSKRKAITTGLSKKRISAYNPYSIQVSSVLNFSTAKTVVAQLKRRGFSAYVVRAKINGKLFYRIRVGPFSSKETARKTLSRLRQRSAYSGSYICK